MAKVRGIVIGTGGFSRCRIGSMVSMNSTTSIEGFVEPSDNSRGGRR